MFKSIVNAIDSLLRLGEAVQQHPACKYECERHGIRIAELDDVKISNLVLDCRDTCGCSVMVDKATVTCTRAKGHTGDHVACGRSNHGLHQWGQG